MTEVKIRKTEKSGDYSTETVFEAKDIDYLHDDLIKELFREPKEEADPEREVKLADVPVSEPGVKCEVVAIYDNAGIPSIMRRFTRVTDNELFGGSDKPHPAFIIGNETYDEIYISVYENCNINGKPYSLPFQKAWVNITNDEAAAACFSKGEGWHMLTAAEWGLLANISLSKGTLPHGNTNAGKYHADPEEHGEVYDSYYTLTGSGPATWTHDHTPEGVHDLCGNHWEMVRGLRIKNGKLQAATNNDAALDIDLTPEGDGWKPICDNNGESITVSVSDENISISTAKNFEQDYTGCEWGEVEIACESEQLKELALYAGEPDVYCYIDRWKPICDNNGESITVSVSDENISISTAKNFEQDYTGCEWGEVEIACESEQLKELALYAGEPDVYCYIDSTDGEYFPIRGGGWCDGAGAGVFCASLYNPRSRVGGYIGFRSAYFKKKN